MNFTKLKSHIFIVFFLTGLIIATAQTDDNGYSGLYINEFMAINENTIKDESEQYDDWIEIYNSADSAINLAGLYLSDNPNDLLKHCLPAAALIVSPKEYLILWADDDTTAGPLHLGFKLSGSGEHIILYDSSGSKIIDQIEFGVQNADISYGRYPDGQDEWLIFLTPTPGDSNIKSSNDEKSGLPEFFSQTGYYSDSLLVELCAEIDSAIYYTINGVIPTKYSNKYQGPFYIKSTKVIRARIIEKDKLPGDVITHTFFINDSTHLPVFSLITDPANLYGTEGILSNRTADWERPVYIQYFTENWAHSYDFSAGIKIHAPDSRKQQSFRLIARSKYGVDYFKYSFFHQKELDCYKTLILRNGGNDGLQLSTGTHLRDPLLHTLYYERNTSNEIASYEPVNVFLNGQYYGIYNLRERQDKYYIAGNRNYSDDIDLLERAFYYPGNRNAIEGDWIHYDSLRSFIDNHDLNDMENYQTVVKMMNIDNFLDYWIFEIFDGNFDWLSNNFKHWRPRSNDGRWKWILWDTDHGFGLPYSRNGINYGDPAWNTLDWATGITGPRVDYGANTIIIRGLLENEQFKNKFINHFADLLNTLFHTGYSIEVFHSMRDRILPQVPRHLKKWNTRSYSSWQSSLSKVEDYLTGRPGYITDFIIEKFDLTGTYKLNLEVSPQSSGRIQLNSILLRKFPWEGDYFNNIPVELTAIPIESYRFLYWELDGRQINQLSLITVPSANQQLIAFFAPDTQAKVVINEINYNSHDDSDSGDWLELYNPQKILINLSGWFLQDESENDPYILPAQTILEPGKFLILCEDSVQFREQYSREIRVIGNFGGETGFGFSGSGERLRLRDNNGNIREEVEYDDKVPWPVEADGRGYTLELKSPTMENNDPVSWVSSIKIGGTPGLKNDCYTSIGKPQVNLPNAFSLDQNYPNPFNPTTTIPFVLPKPARVRIDIYDILGRFIHTLIDEQLSAGWYKLHWDGKNKHHVPLPSSIYIYRLTAITRDGQPFSAVKKMILIR